MPSRAASRRYSELLSTLFVVRNKESFNLVKQSLTNVIDGFEILMSRPLGQPICSRREIGWSTTMGAVMVATPVQELKAVTTAIQRPRSSRADRRWRALAAIDKCHIEED